MSIQPVVPQNAYLGPVSEFIPQAVIKRPIELLARRLDTSVVYATDDLDDFAGFSATYDNQSSLPLAFKHYRGYPKDTTTIYLPPHIVDVEVITRLIAEILKDLRLEQSDLDWQRKDDPDL